MKFEYKTTMICLRVHKKSTFLPIDKIEELIRENLEDMGQDGWELVSTNFFGFSREHILLIYKRRLA